MYLHAVRFTIMCNLFIFEDMYLVQLIIVWIYHHSDCNNDVAVVDISLLLFVTLDNVFEFLKFSLLVLVVVLLVAVAGCCTSLVVLVLVLALLPI